MTAVGRLHHIAFDTRDPGGLALLVGGAGLAGPVNPVNPVNSAD